MVAVAGFDRLPAAVLVPVPQLRAVVRADDELQHRPVAQARASRFYPAGP